MKLLIFKLLTFNFELLTLNLERITYNSETFNLQL